MALSTGIRAAQRAATREQILAAAYDVLRESGVAAMSTLAVQKRAGLSRGALLHHFPTRGDLLRAVIARLVELNEAAVEEALARTEGESRVHRAVLALLATASAESSRVEMDIWAAARTDDALRNDLIEAERTAGRDLNRVMVRAFGDDLAAHPSFPLVVTMTLALLRGLSAGQVLRRSTKAADTAARRWAEIATEMLSEPAPPNKL